MWMVLFYRLGPQWIRVERELAEQKPAGSVGAIPDCECGMTDHCTQFLPLRLTGNDGLEPRTVSQENPSLPELI